MPPADQIQRSHPV